MVKEMVRGLEGGPLAQFLVDNLSAPALQRFLASVGVLKEVGQPFRPPAALDLIQLEMNCWLS